jgi:hypothetical protein
MKRRLIFFCLIGLLAPARAQTPAGLARDWEAQHLSRLEPSRVRHTDLRKYLDELRAAGLRVGEVGRSVAGREIYQVEFGSGPLKVFMWSQMHGDEPTATSALVDLFHYLQKNRGEPWVAAVEKRITLRAVPMLNPDGAELYQRRNLQFIDINRDAQALSTPEGRLLKKLRDEWQPEIGFNLHNQNPRTAVGGTGRQATISLLAVPADAAAGDTPGRVRVKKICAVIYEALAPFIYGHVGRYDDSYNPRAFGDQISRWGTPVLLIETGALHGRSEMDLVRLNFVALAAALRGLADGSVEQANPAVYDALRYNASGMIYNLIVRGGMLVNRMAAGGAVVPPFAGELGVNLETFWSEGQPQTRASLQEVGDLSVFSGLEEVDASGYFVTVARGVLRPGAEASLLFYKKGRAAGIDWSAADLETRFPPDAVFSHGAWGGKEKLPRK